VTVAVSKEMWVKALELPHAHWRLMLERDLRGGRGPSCSAGDASRGEACQWMGNRNIWGLTNIDRKVEICEQYYRKANVKQSTPAICAKADRNRLNQSLVCKECCLVHSSGHLVKSLHFWVSHSHLLYQFLDLKRPDVPWPLSSF
jgi:hypothetical protein